MKTPQDLIKDNCDALKVHADTLSHDTGKRINQFLEICNMKTNDISNVIVEAVSIWENNSFVKNKGCFLKFIDELKKREVIVFIDAFKKSYDYSFVLFLSINFNTLRKYLVGSTFKYDIQNRFFTLQLMDGEIIKLSMDKKYISRKPKKSTRTARLIKPPLPPPPMERKPFPIPMIKQNHWLQKENIYSTVESEDKMKPIFDNDYNQRESESTDPNQMLSFYDFCNSPENMEGLFM